MRPQSIKTNRKQEKNNMHQHFVLWSSIITTLLSFLTAPPPELLNADSSYQNELFLTSITHEQILSLLNRLRDTLSTIQHPSPQIHNLMNLLCVTCTMIPPHPPLPPHYVRRNMKKRNWGAGRGRGPRTKKTKLSNIDVFTKWTDEDLFSFTRMTRAEFLEVYFRTKNDIQKPRIYSSLMAGKKPPIDSRKCKLSTINRLLMVIVWIANYLKWYQIREIFHISKSTLSLELRHILPILVENFFGEIVMPEHLCRLEGSSNVHRLVIGAIDCTHFKIQRPSVMQSVFYRGDKCIHSLIAQAIVDIQGRMLHFTVGYPGSKNDQDVLFFSNISTHIGERKLLADGGYRVSDAVPRHRVDLVTPDRATNLRAQRMERMVVEVSFGYMKRFHALASPWRHRTSLLPLVAMFVAQHCNMLMKRNPIRPPPVDRVDSSTQQ